MTLHQFLQRGRITATNVVASPASKDCIWLKGRVDDRGSFSIATNIRGKIVTEFVDTTTSKLIFVLPLCGFFFVVNFNPFSRLR